MRLPRLLSLALLPACLTPLAAAQTPNAQPAVRYEVSINGEHFTIDADRVVKLQSTEKPGVNYEVAVRVAQYQSWRLNTASFQYHLGFGVSDDRKPSVRTATLKHGLGFVMIVTDLGGALSEAQQTATLDQISKSMQKTSRDSGGLGVAANKPRQRTMGGSQVLGATITHDDADGVRHASLLYLITGQGFTCSCIVECLDADREDIMPLIKPTLESFEPASSTKPADMPATKAGKRVPQSLR